MDLNIQGNAALVTASSSGLGKHAAASLADNGVNVVINGRDEDRVESAVAELRETATGEVVGVPGDITNQDDIRQLVETTVDEFDGLDHLVTSAGGPPKGTVLETTDEEWYNAFDLLVMSVVRVVRHATDHLASGDGGTVVTITSKSVKEAIDSLVLSNSVRMSVIGLEKSLSKELAPEVRVNAVLPGPVETQRHEDLLEQAIERGEYDSYEDGIASETADIPLNRIGQPEELGGVVAFLSSDCSGFINGAAIPIDGGATKSNL